MTESKIVQTSYKFCYYNKETRYLVLIVSLKVLNLASIHSLNINNSSRVAVMQNFEHHIVGPICDYVCKCYRGLTLACLRQPSVLGTND